MVDETVSEEGGAPQGKYYLKFGSVAVSLSNLIAERAEVSETEDEVDGGQYRAAGQEAAQECYKRLLGAFHDSPSVSSIRTPEEPDSPAFGGFGFEAQYDTLWLDDPIELECFLPERLQWEVDAWPHISPDLVDSSRQFNLLYDGVCFAFSRPIKRSGGVLCGAIDARRLLQDILSDFDLIHTAPTPLREDFVIDLAPVEAVRNLTFSLSRPYVVTVASRDGISNPQLFVRGLFRWVSFHLRQFYSLSNWVTELKRIGWEIHDLARQTLAERFNVATTPWYRFRRRRSVIERLENLIHRFYTAYSRWSAGASKLDDTVAEFESMLCEPLTTISEALMKELQLESLPLEPYLRLVELAQKDVESYRNSRDLWITIVASLVSAIIGAAIGALLAG